MSLKATQKREINKHIQRNNKDIMIMLLMLLKLKDVKFACENREEKKSHERISNYVQRKSERYN